MDWKNYEIEKKKILEKNLPWNEQEEEIKKVVNLLEKEFDYTKQTSKMISENWFNEKYTVANQKRFKTKFRGIF